MKSTRTEAKEAGEKHYFTGKPCKHGHTTKRLTSTGGCMECYRILHANKLATDPDYKARQAALRDSWAASDRGKAMSAASRKRRLSTIRAQERERRADGRYKGQRRARHHSTLKHCPQYKIRRNIGNRICGMLKGTSTGQTISRILRLCGYRIQQLKAHLEKQFLPGMSWENYGRTGWHIDHIVPASSFDQTDDEQFASCWSLANLRPTWATENIQKSNHHHFLL